MRQRSPVTEAEKQRQIARRRSVTAFKRAQHEIDERRREMLRASSFAGGAKGASTSGSGGGSSSSPSGMKNGQSSTMSPPDAFASFTPKDVAHLTVLSRIVEPLRFTVGPDRLEEVVSIVSLKAAFTSHFEFLEEKARREAAVRAQQQAAAQQGRGSQSEAELHQLEQAAQQRDDARAARMHRGLEEVHANLTRAWDVIERGHTAPLHSVTFGDIFDYEFPSFPESTATQRSILAALASVRDFITVKDVTSALGVDADDQLVRFLFASGARVLPREVFADVVGCLEKHPRGVSFTHHFVRNMAETGMVMSTLLPHLVVLIAVLFIGPSLVRTAHTRAYANALHYIDNDWSQGCPYGPLSPLGCNFLGKHFLTSARPEIDVNRYLKTELISILWREPNRTLRNLPSGGAFPVGALVIRGVRGVGDPAESPGSCEALNLTTITTHWEVPMQFPCTHDWAAVIPYDSTLAEALAIANATVRLPSKNITSTYSIITHFAAYHPSDGIVVYAKILMTFPPGGTVMPRLFLSPIDPTMHEPVLPLLVLKAAAFVWIVILSVVYGTAGLPWMSMLGSDAVLTGLIAAAYGTLRSVDGLLRDQDLNQTQYAPAGFDEAQDVFDSGMSLLGFFVLLYVASSIRYFKYIRGLQLLYDILTASVLEIGGLIFMFLVWSFGFICVAMVLFGPTVPEFSNMAVATRAVLLYFTGVRDFDILFDNNPIVGPLFFFAFTLFVIYFAVNLLIAVLTAPLAAVKEKNNLQRSVYEKTRAVLGEESYASRLRLDLQYMVLWPLLNLVLDSLFFTQRHWLRWYKAFTAFYHIPERQSADETAVRVTAAAADLLALMSSDPSRHVYGDSIADETDLAQSHNASSQQQLQVNDVTDDASSVATERMQALEGTHKLHRAPGLWRTPLARVAIGHKVMDALPLALTFVTIFEEVRFDAARDARLMRSLRDYDAFSVELLAVEQLQEQLAERAAAITEPMRALLDAAAEVAKLTPEGDPDFTAIEHMPEKQTTHYKEVARRIVAVLGGAGEAKDGAGGGGGGGGGVVASGQRRSLGDISPVAPPDFEMTPKIKRAGDPLPHVPPVTPGGTNNDGIVVASPDGSPLDETAPRRRRTVVVHGDSPRRTTTDPVPLGSNASSNKAASAASMSPPSEVIGAADDIDADDEDSNGGEPAIELTFNFTRQTRNDMSNASQLLFYSLTTILFGIIFFVPFGDNFDTSAYLVRTLNLGLRDLELNLECYDASCMKAWSMNKTFMSVGDLSEYYQWLQTGLYRQLYLRDDLGLPEAGTGSVYWDPRVVLDSPVYFRQQRLRIDRGCPADLATDFDQRVLAANTWCFGDADADGFATEPMARPINSTVPVSAYIFQDRCAEDEPKEFLGRFADYPCAGYQTAVTSAAEFKALVASRWFDGATRLATMTAVFNFGNTTRVEYTMHMEFSENGGGCFGRAFSFPLASDASLFDLGSNRLTFQILLAIDLGLSFVWLVRYLIAKYGQNLDDEAVEDLRPSVPVVPLLIAFVVFVLVNVVLPPNVQETRNKVAVVICAIIYLEYNFTTAIVFPSASLISKKVKILIRTLHSALLQLLYVVPYFIVVLWGMLLGGFILFGRFVPPMGRIRWALMEMTLMAFTGSINNTALQAARFIEAALFLTVFFAAVLVVLANMFLAMVTSASGDAQGTFAPVALSEGVLKLFGYKALYGEFLDSFLFFSIKLVDPTGCCSRFARFATPRTRESAMLLARGRVLFPTEVLVTTMHPLLIKDILARFSTDRINTSAYAALGPYLLDRYHTFITSNPHKSAQDNGVVQYQEQLAASRRILLALDDAAGSGDFTSGGTAGEFVNAFGVTSRDPSFDMPHSARSDRAGAPLGSQPQTDLVLEGT